MEWNMLRESKKLFPHWLDKNENSNFSKHLNILNNQQTDIRHKLKTVDWSKLLNKPLQIHKIQTEPYKWKVEFEVNVPQLKEVNIYKNPTIVGNQVVNNYKVIEGYYYNNKFYKYHNKEITNHLDSEVSEESQTHYESNVKVSDKYENRIYGEEGQYYYDLGNEKYYIFENDVFNIVSEEEVPQTSLIHSESFIDNYSHFFRHILYDENKDKVYLNKIISDSDNNITYKTISSNSNDFTIDDVGKYEIVFYDSDSSPLYYNDNTDSYCVFKDDEPVEPTIYRMILQDKGVEDNLNPNAFSYNTDALTITTDEEGTLVENINSGDARVYSAKKPNASYVDWEYPFTVEFDIVEGDDNVRIQVFKINSSGNYVSRTLSDLGNPSHVKLEYDGEIIRYYVNGKTTPKYSKSISLENPLQIRFSLPDNTSFKYKNYKIYTGFVNGVDNVGNGDNGIYYISNDTFSDKEYHKIPLVEIEDITPVVSNDKYVLEVYTWNDYHFLKGFPEIDFIDYNNNNIIDVNERTYDNLSIEIEEISNKEYLTFRVHQYGIKLVEIFKDEKPIHIADFIIEKLGYSNKQINSNFAHIYNYNDNEVYYFSEKDTNTVEEINLDVDEYVWRTEISEDDKIYDENGNFELKNKYDLKVTYYDAAHPYDSNYDKVLTKTYVCEDSVFYHDVSLDMLGALYNVHRYVFMQPIFENHDEEIEFYSKTYPSYCNSFTEDDYHYQKRLQYYINNYNKIYFPVLELWKYFHIDSELVNRKVIVAEQNYSYMRTLEADENKYINELSKNKLESFYNNYSGNSFEEEVNYQKPKLKSTIAPEDYVNSRNGILLDENLNYVTDEYGTFVRVDYEYEVFEEEMGNRYVIEYENASRKFQWYNAEKDDNNLYSIKLTDSLKVVPNTRYQLRFCVKEYPQDLNLRIIYKNNDGDAREVEEKILERKDYDEIDEFEEYNELTYTHYDEEWGVVCEYICTNIITVPNAQNIELCLESPNSFKISDITLQRVTINHFDSEYMKTSTDYNSCVYDLYADYNKIPSNIRYDDLNIFSKILNRSLPLTKKGYFNFAISNTDTTDDMLLDDSIEIYLSNMLDVESSITSAREYLAQDGGVRGNTSDIWSWNEYNVSRIVGTAYTVLTPLVNETVGKPVRADVPLPRSCTIEFDAYPITENGDMNHNFVNLRDGSTIIKSIKMNQCGMQDYHWTHVKIQIDGTKIVVNDNIELSANKLVNRFYFQLSSVKNLRVRDFEIYRYSKDHFEDITEKIYKFNKYVQKGDYEIIISPYETDENNLISNIKINIKMLIFKEDNTAYYETVKITNLKPYLESDGNNTYYRIPFENKSNNSFEIKIYRTNAFSFNNLKVIRKAPLTLEEIIE